MPRRPRATPTQDAPYRRIASDLRRRIAKGELQPGARLPSTRQLALQWQVTPATAAKALGSLQHEGVIRALPRVGNVVAGAQPARANAHTNHAEAPPAITRDRIAQIAIALADAQGLAAVSMRVVANQLDMPTMSLYGQVHDKHDLLQLMIDRAFAQAQVPAERSGDWRAGLELSARMLWTLYRRHPWLAHVVTITRPLPLPNMIAHADWALGSLAELGLDSATMLHIHILVYSYVRGLAINLESEAEAEAETGLDEQAWSETQAESWHALTASGKFATFARVFSTLEKRGFDLDLDALFEFGLQPLLDGFAPLIARAAANAKQHG